ncbi:hypothetical protein FQA47_018339 [Oryzias melastigma]|uniref:Uncharacterized protein n=1 Tax=Oryzias melastigma TaxID=30732 RepID=A0A834FRY2_ORYME|nr:hypothetical protein FQA47_018339 [Oryzias melastigma]
MLTALQSDRKSDDITVSPPPPRTSTSSDCCLPQTRRHDRRRTLASHVFLCPPSRSAQACASPAPGHRRVTVGGQEDSDARLPARPSPPRSS